MKILVIEGAGHIGSHAIVARLKASRDVVALDNLAYCTVQAMTRAAELDGKEVSLIPGGVRELVLGSVWKVGT
ncbi:hypothetical protein [Halomonas sp. M4R1S46]|uniref:hypothetical protein n=1 Tax=Halomonas sp. M4R1S46 TaxID=2982692 RepID=UPI0021E3C3DE|nr:hypothetical protein [Halomonas sp. M4R1S46]UYG06320.1 hypothetical protein OCT48_11820 [Halomonas sp. M4R1S46]